jgi:DNA polymerase-3 subunit alpha
MAQTARPYTPLHLHTEASALDGACVPHKLATRLKELGMQACACTDHGNIQAWPVFERTLKAEGIKPIFGLEAYLTDDMAQTKTQGRDASKTWHLTLLVENEVGLQNMIKLSTYSFTRGLTLLFGRPRPRCDWELVREHAEGLICLSGCMASPLMSELFQGNLSQAREYAERLLAIFGPDRFFVELQNVGIRGEIPAYSELGVKLGRCPGHERYDPSLRRHCEALVAAAEADPRDAGKQRAAAEARALLERRATLSQTEANREAVAIAHELGVGYVATADTHYLRASEASFHDAMICLGTGQIPQRGERKFSLLPQLYHLRSHEEMLEAFPEWPEALAATNEIADRCNAHIAYGKPMLPRFPLPEGRQSASDYLRELVEHGLRERLSVAEGEELPAAYRERMEFELATIAKMGFADYFLVVHDLLHYAHREGIPAGPGRGSAAGSLVAWALSITQLDPLRYGLLFERFLNPDRISMPDMDLDFSQLRLHEMREYARRTYNPLAGSETGVAQIITFATYKAKGALKNACRVLAEPTPEGKAEALKLGNRLAAAIPSKPGVTLEEVWNDPKKEWTAQRRQLRSLVESSPQARKAFELALWLEGMIATYGQHAAAVVISDHPLEEDLPLMVQVSKSDRILTTQWAMNDVEKVGALKMDFLGLRNLDIIDQTLEKIRHVRGRDYGSLKRLYETLPLDDPETLALFARGETVGTFQFESSGMRSALQEVKVDRFEDLIALVALYRPGPMASIPSYAARKHGREQVSYPDDRLEPILAETYGLTVFQEQSMLIARELAGFTPGQADELRKAIGKKLRDKMDELKKPFLEGCKANGVPEQLALRLWEDNERSADYSFNKSHAACYALIAYYTGYLKAHYPEEYMASLLSSVMTKSDKLRLYLAEARRMKLRVLPPDLNRSLRDFSVWPSEREPGRLEILFGLNALSGVGEKMVERLREERKRGGNFTSIYDLVRRCSDFMDVKTLQALVQGGALDSTGASRKAMYEAARDILEGEKKRLRALEKAFVEAVKKRALAGAEPALLDPGKRRPTLAAEAKVALQAAAAAAFRAPALADEELERAVEEGLEREALRLARAEARRAFKDGGVETAAASIADEEGGQRELRDLVEERAQRQTAAERAHRRALAKRLADAVAPLVRAELAARAESEDLMAALSEASEPELPTEEWPQSERLNRERAILGIYVTGHPLDADKLKWARYVSKGLGDISAADISESGERPLRVVGAVTDVQRSLTRKGDPWYRVTLEDLTGAREITLFKPSFEGKEELLEVGTLVCMEVRVEEDTFVQSRREEQGELAGETGEELELAVKLQARGLYRWQPEQISDSTLRSLTAAEEATQLDLRAAQSAARASDAGNGTPPAIRIRLSAKQLTPELRQQLKQIFAEHPGDTPVKIVVDGTTYGGISITPSEELRERVQALLRDARQVGAER